MLAECITGFLVGIAARYIVPDSQGLGTDTLVGILGGGVGAFLYKRFGHKPSFDQFDLWSICVAAIDAFLLILVVRAAAGRRTIAP